MLMVEKVEVVTKVDASTIRVRNHACDQAKERFKHLNGSDEKIKQWIIGKYKQSTFVSVVNSEKYGSARLFQHGDISIVVDISQNLIHTVYPSKARNSVKKKVLTFYATEKKRLANKLKKITNRNNKQIADLEVQRATINRDMLYMRSEGKLNASQSMIKAIENEIIQLTEEICEIQTEYNELEISLSAQNI